LYVIFSGGQGTPIAVPDKVTAVDAVDIDADGDNDLAVGYESKKKVEIWLNDGNGMFQHEPMYDRETGTGTIDIAHGDIDGDGGVDLVVANKGANAITVFRCIPNQ
jgi:hypothetical protein